MKQLIHTDFIKLDALLKLTDLVSSGGEAKLRIQSGEVFVNGAPCTMRGKKCYPGDKIKLENKEITVVGACST